MKNTSFYILFFFFITTNLFATITIEPPLALPDINCGEPLPAGQVLVATTDCPTSGAIVTFSVDPYFEDLCGGTQVTYRWTATDNCGDLEEVFTSFFILPDVNEPIVTGVPADVTVECGNIPNAPSITAIDDCSQAVTITFSENILNGSCPSSFIIIRTWVATDDCGNTSSADQNITVDDFSVPVLIGVPVDMTVECDNIPVAPVIGSGILAIDNCNPDVQISFIETVTPGVCTDSYSILREWIADDACGNAVSQVQHITVEDITAPILSPPPADITVDCDNIPFADNPTATDNCDTNVDVVFTEVVTNGPCASYFYISREWTAIDNCGNQFTQTQVVTVEDNTAPVFDVAPSPVSDINCGDALPTQEGLTATDNCNPDVIITMNNDIGLIDNCGGTAVTYTWIAEDGCANSTIVTMSFNVLPDTEAPVFDNAPAPIADINCGDPFPAQEVMTASDNCGIAIVTANSNYTEDCINGYVVTYTWIAVDDCGNSTTTSSSFNVLSVEECETPSAVSSLVISGNVVKLSWIGTSAANRYRIRYRPVGGTWTEALTGGIETFRFLNGLTPNTTYQYQVKSLCTASNSTWSSTATFTTLNDICDRPANSGVTNTTSTSTTVYWTSYPNDIKYRIKYKATDYSNPWTEVTLNPTTYNLTGLTASTNYKYKLKTKCSGGWSNWSSNYTFATPASFLSDIVSRKANTTIQVFPNPASNVVRVSLEKEANVIRILNVNGKLMKEVFPTSTTEKIDIQNWSTGMYILTVLYNDGTMNTEQFVKMN